MPDRLRIQKTEYDFWIVLLDGKCVGTIEPRELFTFRYSSRALNSLDPLGLDPKGWYEGHIWRKTTTLDEMEEVLREHLEERCSQ